MDIKNKAAVITGAGSGIGRALAQQLSKTCRAIAISDINPENLAETVKSLEQGGAKVFSRAFDVAKREEVEAFAEWCASELGQVDILINNAGVALAKVGLDNMKYEDFEWVMNVNFWGMVYGAKAFLPHLTSQKESCVVNISSLFGIMGVGYQLAYCASKFAIRGFTESLRMEAMDRYPGLNVMSVHPGGIKTNIARNSRLTGEETKEEHEKTTAQFEEYFINTPDKAAKDIIKGIRKNKGRVLIGRDAKFMAFLTRLLPEKYIFLAGREMKKQMENA